MTMSSVLWVVYIFDMSHDFFFPSNQNGTLTVAGIVGTIWFTNWASYKMPEKPAVKIKAQRVAVIERQGLVWLHWRELTGFRASDASFKSSHRESLVWTGLDIFQHFDDSEEEEHLMFSSSLDFGDYSVRHLMDHEECEQYFQHLWKWDYWCVLIMDVSFNFIWKQILLPVLQYQASTRTEWQDIKLRLNFAWHAVKFHCVLFIYNRRECWLDYYCWGLWYPFQFFPNSILFFPKFCFPDSIFTGQLRNSIHDSEIAEIKGP